MDKNIKILTIDYDFLFNLDNLIDSTCYWAGDYNDYGYEFVEQMVFYEKEFLMLKEFFKNLSQPVYISENHVYPYNHLKDKGILSCDITNIDRHSDLWICENFMPNCASWIDGLSKICNVNLTWVCAEGCSHSSGYSEINEKISCVKSNNVKSVLSQEYDYIYLIQSSEYSPSHMQHKFRELVSLCKETVYDEEYEIIYRTYSEEIDNLLNSDGDFALIGTEIEDENDYILLSPNSDFMSNWEDVDPEYLN